MVYAQDRFNKIVCIGASTGGPGALQKVLSKLPKDFPAPVLIVQHMPAKFTRLLAERLDSLSRVKVKEARNGEIVAGGTAYVAPGDFHMTVKIKGKNAAVSISQTPPVRGHRPSVNKLFASLASLEKYEKIAVIMTGMGSDGAEGLLTLKQANATYAIAESKQSSVVYGMPKSAVNTHQIDEIVHLDDIAQTIIEKVDGTGKSDC